MSVVRARAALACAFLLGVSLMADAAAMSATELFQSFEKNPYAHPNLPNCSFAGYRYSEVPLPQPKVVANVKESGAKGDGATDDQAAFEAAIKKAKAAGGGAILVPAGTYKLSGLLRLDASNLVLRGEGRDKTILAFQKSLTDLLGTNMTQSKKVRWSWMGGLVWIGPAQTWDAAGKMTRQSWEQWQNTAPLTEVTAAQKRGDFTVQVRDGSKLKPGTMVLLSWTDPRDNSFVKHVGGHVSMQTYNQYGALAGCTWNWPVEIAKVQGNAVELKQPLRVDIRPEWNVRFLTLGDSVSEVGVEGLTLQMPQHKVAAHLMDVGFNGIFFNCAYHCWANDIKLVNVDVGVNHSTAKCTTVSNLLIAGQANHHATALRGGSHDNLIQEFVIESKPHHGINTEGMSTGNVWRKGLMKSGTFDSHCAMSFEFIRTNIVVNSVGTPGGAGDAGPFVGGRVAHWNVKMTGGTAEWINGPDYLPMGALVGVQAPRHKGCGWHMPPGDKGCLIVDEGQTPTPPDLFEAQLALRLKTKGK